LGLIGETDALLNFALLNRMTNFDLSRLKVKDLLTEIKQYRIQLDDEDAAEKGMETAWPICSR